MTNWLKNFYKKQGFLLSIATLFLFSLFYFISIKTPLAGDDWGYAINGSNNNPFVMAYQFYFSWSGRFFSELYGFIITPHKWLWNILNALLFSSIFIYMMSFIEGKRKWGTLLLALFLMLSVKDDLRMETYTWLMGTTYVIPLALSLYSLLKIKDIVLDVRPLSSIEMISVSLSLFIIGLMMENIAVVMIVALFISQLTFRIKKLRYSKSLFMFFSISIISFILLRLSPGSQYRLLRDSSEWIELGIIKQLMYNYPNFIQLTFLDHRYIILTLSISLLILSLMKIKMKILKYMACAVFILSGFISISLTLSTYMPSFDFSVFTNPSSFFNLLFWIVFIICTYITLFFGLDENDRLLSIYFVTLAGLSNGVMMLSPIFGYRSTLYTAYFLIILILILYQNIELHISLRVLTVIVLVLFVGKITHTYLYKYNLVDRVTNLRNAELTYYKDHPESGDAWLLRYPIYTIHGADIEAGDSYHMDVFKEYYHLDSSLNLIFYFPDNSYEDYLNINGY